MNIFLTVLMYGIVGNGVVPQAQPANPLSMGTADYEEAQLFCRFLEQNNIRAGMTTGLGITIVPLGHGKISNKLFDSYEMGFGVDLRQRDKRGRIVLPFPVIRLEFTVPISSQAFLGDFSNSSLLLRAYQIAVNKGRILTSEKVKFCHYSVRAWLTENGKRTEHITSTLCLVSKGQDRLVRLQYPE